MVACSPALASAHPPYCLPVSPVLVHGQEEGECGWLNGARPILVFSAFGRKSQGSTAAYPAGNCGRTGSGSDRRSHLDEPGRWTYLPDRDWRTSVPALCGRCLAACREAPRQPPNWIFVASEPPPSCGRHHECASQFTDASRRKLPAGSSHPTSGGPATERRAFAARWVPSTKLPVAKSKQACQRSSSILFRSFVCLFQHHLWRQK